MNNGKLTYVLEDIVLYIIKKIVEIALFFSLRIINYLIISDTIMNFAKLHHLKHLLVASAKIFKKREKTNASTSVGG